MNYLSRKKRARILACLVEGLSVRATGRLMNCSKDTVIKLLVSIGPVCAEYQDEHLRNLTCQRIECDEIWSFCYAKAANATNKLKATKNAGNVWTWVAIDPETKLVPSWLVGGRDADYANAFMQDLASRLTHRVQLTTDGLNAYLEAVEGAFGANIDFAQLVKLYGRDPEGEQKYSPAKCLGTRTYRATGRPDPELIGTSIVERQNLTMRMQMRRLTRLTNAFTKKLDNHVHHTNLYYMHYNFCRIHGSLRVTPAMAAGVSNHVWDLADVVALLEARETAKEAQLGPRRTRLKLAA